MQEHAKTWPDSGNGVCALYALVLASEDDSVKELQHGNTMRPILTNLARPELNYRMPSC